MNGLELSREFYTKYGAPMLHERFPEYEHRAAVGLCGHGSECFGYDDELSRDHDFDGGFYIWLTREDFIAVGREMHSAYEKLPHDGDTPRSRYGRGRGVRMIDEFFGEYTGLDCIPQSWEDWLGIPEYSLAEALNGEVFRDDLGCFTQYRSALGHMPEDVCLKRLAAYLALAAQAGQYNLQRCAEHGEYGAAMLSAARFAENIIPAIFLLNGSHAPYYKWMLRGLRKLPLLGNMADAIEFMLTEGNTAESLSVKAGVADDISAAVIHVLQERGLTHGNWDYLEPHAIEITEHISDSRLASLHLMVGV